MRAVAAGISAMTAAAVISAVTAAQPARNPTQVQASIRASACQDMSAPSLFPPSSLPLRSMLLTTARYNSLLFHAHSRLPRARGPRSRQRRRARGPRLRLAGAPCAARRAPTSPSTRAARCRSAAASPGVTVARSFRSWWRRASRAPGGPDGGARRGRHRGSWRGRGTGRRGR